ncbi:MAG: hypothetical protein V3R76_11365 [Gammaproteobacteria bacterium]
MDTPDSPFRLLAKNYANELITRGQYVTIRAQLLKKLQHKGNVDRADLDNLILISRGEGKPDISKSYSASDWIIIALGLVASIVLGFVLYS